MAGGGGGAAGGVGVDSCSAKAGRGKSFEVTIAPSGGGGAKGAVVIWSGIKRGPPRALKFPSDDEIKAAFHDAVTRF